jgi:heterotetrameric sarcosine oxidase gamma subunit
MAFAFMVDDVSAMTRWHSILKPRSPLAHLPVQSDSDRGVIVRDRDDLGLAMILVRKGKEAALAQRIREHFHLELPRGPHRRVAGHLALAGVGPGAWLATHDRSGNALVWDLRAAIGDLASITDQSDGYVVLQLEGPRVHATLEKLLPVDLHPKVFEAGQVAVTAAGHIGATLWRLADGEDNKTAFEVAVFRSMAQDFWRLLCKSAAEFGIGVTV